MPSLTVIVPLVKMPRPNSDVPLVSGTVPVPVAGALTTGAAALEAAELREDDEPVELVDDTSLEPRSRFERALHGGRKCGLTRFSAV